MSREPTKYFFRQRHQNRLYDIVIEAIENVARKRGIRRKDIAETLGIPPSQVTRLFSGPANWTADTVSDLLYAIDAEMDFRVVPFSERARANQFHPAGELREPPRSTQSQSLMPGPLRTPSSSARSDGIVAWGQ
jgi:predicted XRE-type DNA-binding protein